MADSLTKPPRTLTPEDLGDVDAILVARVDGQISEEEATKELMDLKIWNPPLSRNAARAMVLRLEDDAQTSSLGATSPARFERAGGSTTMQLH